ncbi:MAG: DUF4190 domain-containing protein [Microlunatus sp.]
MTDSGSGQRDDQGQGQDRSGQDPSADDYRPSASWETSRGSSWENTTPYESRPGEGSWPNYPGQDQPQGYSSAGGYGSAGSYGSASGYGSATSYGSASDPQGQQAPSSQPTYGPPDYGQPPAQPGYGQPGYGPQGGYDQQGAYGQQGGYDQAGYGQAQPTPYGVAPYQQGAYPPYRPSHPKATMALILGIIGVTVCPFAGIGGFIVGRRVRAEVDAAPDQWEGRSLATAGWVMGIISIVFSAFWIVYGIFIIVIAISSY